MALAVQWLQLHTSTAVATGSIPDQETKTLHATICSPKKKKKIKIVTLRNTKWNLIVVLFCIFLMANGAEHLFICLLTFYMSCLEK